MLRSLREGVGGNASTPQNAGFILPMLSQPFEENSRLLQRDAVAGRVWTNQGLAGQFLDDPGDQRLGDPAAALLNRGFQLEARTELGLYEQHAAHQRGDTAVGIFQRVFPLVANGATGDDQPVV